MVQAPTCFGAATSSLSVGVCADTPVPTDSASTSAAHANVPRVERVRVEADVDALIGDISIGDISIGDTLIGDTLIEDMGSALLLKHDGPQDGSAPSRKM